MCLMKKFMKSFALLAVAALGLSACNDDKLVPDNGNADGKFVTVHFGAEAAIEGATKATLTPNEAETMFASAWETTDVISVKYIAPSNKEAIVPATWNGTSFEAKGLPNEHGDWYYQACYPKPDEKDNHIDFGGARIQDGNKYNSAYDVMICELALEEGADAGKTADGKDVVFNMDRKTGIAYFHLTGGPVDEKVVSATLSVEDGFIASQHAYISGFAFAPSEDLKEITITYKEGTAPMASDFQLWYNVLPTKYTKMTLTVETANHTLTISRTAADNYAAGKLYKVVKNIPAEKWVKKVTANDGSLERPYTAAEAIAVIDASPNPSEGVTNQHVKGIVKASPSFNATYSSLSYDIVSGEATLYIYSGRDLRNADFVGAEDLKAGDEVVVLGTLKKYTDKAGVVKYELDKSNYLISINGKTEIYRGLVVSGQKTAFTVGDAFEFGGKALQVWRGKEDVDVTASATFSGYDMSTEGKQTITVTVGEETVTYEINVRAAGGEAPKTYTLQFGTKYNSEEIQNYTSTWSATCEEFTWDMVNWNNNRNGWTYVKAGPKGNTNAHAMISTNSAMPEAISKISITIDKVENGSITSIVLKSSSTNDFKAGTVIETKSSVGKGEVVFEISSPQNGLYYQLDFTLNNTTPNSKKGKNGVATVSKVVYTNN